MALFLIWLRNKSKITVTINGGQIVVKIGTAKLIIDVRPRLHNEALIKMFITIQVWYFTLPLEIFSKKYAVAPARPIAVVRQAKPTIIPKMSVPVLPSK